MKKRNFLSYLLSHSAAYRAAMALLGRRNSVDFIISKINIKSGQKILDIGCGPANVLSRLKNITYVGIDSNDRYISLAKKKYGTKGEFYYLSAGVLPNFENEKFDRILFLGVLHHLSDDEIIQMIPKVKSLLTETGRVITHDPVRLEKQKRVSKILMDFDRGKYIRDQQNYVKFFEEQFAHISTEVRTDSLRVPYSILFIEAHD
jgi:ubiquinone/menaquinone biosynthesis C-methylase UbiE